MAISVLQWYESINIVSIDGDRDDNSRRGLQLMRGVSILKIHVFDWLEGDEGDE